MDKDTSNVIDTLDDLFVFLGASDVGFKVDHFSYPGGKALQTAKPLGFNGSPQLSGLPMDWECSLIFLLDGLFSGFNGRDLHWSQFSMMLKHYADIGKQIDGGKQKGSSSDFDSYASFKYFTIDWSGKQTFERRDTVAFKGLKWHELGRSQKGKVAHQPVSEEWLIDGYKILMSFAASEPAFWMAKIKLEPDVPGLALITDPIGVRSLLKLRDIPQGKKRREALLHWVSEHWRQQRKDEESESYVRKHLRGAEKCTYKAYSIDVQASKEDDVQNMLYEKERAAMRLQADRPDVRKRPKFPLLKRGK